MWTGDEMGYLNKWDLNDLIDKFEEMRPVEKIEASNFEMK